MSSKRRITSGGFILVSLFVVGYFFLTTQIKVEFETYFKPEYYLQFSMLLLAATLLNAGILLFKGSSKANLMLAIYGYMALAEMLFDLLAITVVNMPWAISLVFTIAALPAIWIAHTNAFDTKKLPLAGLIISVALGLIESLLPVFL